MSGNDTENDQSDLLGLIPKEILKKSILPLGDLQSKEVQKLRKIMGLWSFIRSLKLGVHASPQTRIFFNM